MVVDEVVALFRAVASDPRLRILRQVDRSRDLTVGELSARVDIPQPLASRDVRVLAGVGLLDARPSGRRVHLFIPKRAAARDDLVGTLNDLLSQLWLGLGEANPTHINVWDWLGIDPRDEEETEWESVAGRLILFSTAYTHLRRLLLLRELARKGPALQDQLLLQIGMSPSAVSRQLTKLRVRGLVECVSVDNGSRWRLCKPEPVLQRRMHQEVMRTLTRRTATGNPVH